jgi:hypothetical protein
MGLPGLPNPFKLEKLRITAYGEAARSSEIDHVDAMYNPASYSLRHENVFEELAAIQTSGQPARWTRTPPSSLSLELMLDGTGVGEMGLVSLLGGGPDPVADQVEKFLEVCLKRDGSIHEPRFLTIQWGRGLEEFKCRLQSVDVSYTSFEKNGDPLAATLTTVFLQDVPVQEEQSSPDLTHRRTVLAGDTLPLLCREIYGSAAHYLWVARQNQLDDFRRLAPGQELAFPPLPKDLRGRASRAPGGASRAPGGASRAPGGAR